MPAAIVAGVAFATAPYRAGQLAHLQVLTSQWMPAMFLALHGYVETRRRRWLVPFALAWLLQAASNGYFLLFLPVLIGLWLLWFVDWRRTPRVGLAIVATWIVAALPLVPALLEYRRVHAELGLGRQADEIVRFSATAASLTHVAPMLRFWRASAVPTQEDYLFPGVTGIAVILLALCWSLFAAIARRYDASTDRAARHDSRARLLRPRSNCDVGVCVRSGRGRRHHGLVASLSPADAAARIRRAASAGALRHAGDVLPVRCRRPVDRPAASTRRPYLSRDPPGGARRTYRSTARWIRCRWLRRRRGPCCRLATPPSSSCRPTMRA